MITPVSNNFSAKAKAPNLNNNKNIAFTGDGPLGGSVGYNNRNISSTSNPSEIGILKAIMKDCFKKDPIFFNPAEQLTEMNDRYKDIFNFTPAEIKKIEVEVAEELLNDGEMLKSMENPALVKEILIDMKNQTDILKNPAIRLAMLSSERAKKMLDDMKDPIKRLFHMNQTVKALLKNSEEENGRNYDVNRFGDPNKTFEEACEDFVTQKPAQAKSQAKTFLTKFLDLFRKVHK